MNRELDVKIAKAKGLVVVGETECARHPENTIEIYLNPGYTGNWFIGVHPVYVDDCVCDLYDNGRIPGLSKEKIGEHYRGCLAIVPFWSSDLNTAMELVTELDESDFVFAYWLHHQKGEKWQFMIHLFIDGVPADAADSSGDTPMEAICNAYLAWCDLTKNKS